MKNYFEADQQNGYLIYPLENQLILHQKRGTQISRPVVLCQDYAKHFDAIFYHGILYYIYCNEEGQYHIKSVSSVNSLFVLPFSENIISLAFALIGNELALFYLEEDKTSLSLPCRLRYMIPFLNGISPTHILNMPSPASFTCHSISKGLFLFAKGSKEMHLYLIGSDFSFQKLHLEQEIAMLKETIESASAQYEQLMQTAQKYREEAIKWRGKYIKE